MIAYRLARAQGFGEGNNRTALLVAKWVLDRNDVEGEKLIPPNDRLLGDLLIQAASGHYVEQPIIALLEARSSGS